MVQAISPSNPNIWQYFFKSILYIVTVSYTHLDVYKRQGLHVGKVRRHPVSHGCVRLPRNVAEILYRQTSIGTPVTSQKTPLPVPEAQKIPPAQQQEAEGRKQ